ncbi:MAG: HEPN domain-containing protein [Chloroflexota bacterium]
MNEIASEWVAKAEGDFDAADLTLHGREAPIIDAVCFHSQQCAEKYLKAFLQEHQIRFEPRHELVPLLELCLTLDDGFEILRGSLQSLERYAVLIRYPGLIVPAEMAEQAFESASRVRNFVRQKLGG